MVFIRNLLSVTVALAGCVAAMGVSAANIKISDESVRAVSAVSGNAAGYMTLINKDSKPVRLESIDSDVAAKTEIHGHTMEGGMMKMYKLSEGLELPPGKEVELKTGGYHIMLMGLKAKLTEGESVSATLHFSDGDAIDVKMPVKIEKGMAH